MSKYEFVKHEMDNDNVSEIREGKKRGVTDGGGKEAMAALASTVQPEREEGLSAVGKVRGGDGMMVRRCNNPN